MNGSARTLVYGFQSIHLSPCGKSLTLELDCGGDLHVLEQGLDSDKGVLKPGLWLWTLDSESLSLGS